MAQTTRKNHRKWQLLLFLVLIFQNFCFNKILLCASTPTITIGDTNGLWDEKENIQIFDNITTVAGIKQLAPGSQGEYHFYLSNMSEYSATYQFQLVENMQYPIRYSLVENDVNWHIGTKNSLEFLKNSITTIKSVLASGQTQNYTLFWGWTFSEQSDEIDTNLGQLTDAEREYTLSFKFITIVDNNNTNNSNKILLLICENKWFFLLFGGALLLLNNIIITSRNNK